MDVNQYILNNVDELRNNTLELYQIEHVMLNFVLNEVIIPSPIETFVTDIECNKFILPETLKVLDIWGNNQNNTTFNISDNLNKFIIRNTNIINIDIMKLFKKQWVSFKFYNCKFNNIDLNILLSKYYKKYFNEDPKNTCDSEQYKHFMNNNISSKRHYNIITKIIHYEDCITEKKKFSNIIREELVASAFHPDRIGPLITKYGIDIVETL